MKVNPNGVGVENYVDSPVFIEIVLALAAITFGSIAWLELRKPHGSVLVSLALAASALLCIVGMLAQKRRTFLFDASARTLTWASRGLRERAAGRSGSARVLEKESRRALARVPESCGGGRRRFRSVQDIARTLGEAASRGACRADRGPASSSSFEGFPAGRRRRPLISSWLPRTAGNCYFVPKE